MTMRYSASAGGFFPTEINYPDLPNDLVDITYLKHAQLMAAQAEGYEIVPSPNPTEGPRAVRPSTGGADVKDLQTVVLPPALLAAATLADQSV